MIMRDVAHNLMAALQTAIAGQSGARLDLIAEFDANIQRLLEESFDIYASLDSSDARDYVEVKDLMEWLIKMKGIIFFADAVEKWEKWYLIAESSDAIPQNLGW